MNTRESFLSGAATSFNDNAAVLAPLVLGPAYVDAWDGFSFANQLGQKLFEVILRHDETLCLDDEALRNLVPRIEAATEVLQALTQLIEARRG